MARKLMYRKNLRNHGPKFKFNLEKLKDRKVAGLFEATTGCKFAVINLLENKQTISQKNINGGLIDTASKVGRWLESS